MELARCNARIIGNFSNIAPNRPVRNVRTTATSIYHALLPNLPRKEIARIIQDNSKQTLPSYVHVCLSAAPCLSSPFLSVFITTKAVTKHGFRWIFGMFSTENIFVFCGKSPERIPPDVFCNSPSLRSSIRNQLPFRSIRM